MFLLEPTDAVYATGYAGNGYRNISTGVVFKFVDEIVDRLNSYDVTIGIDSIFFKNIC